MIQNAVHEYSDGSTRFVGKLAWDDTIEQPMPGLIIAPAFGGLGPFEMAQAEDLAALGYCALAIDYYGDGLRASSNEEASRFMKTLNENRTLLGERMVCALNELKSLELVDQNRVGAMGYCFGGKCVLDLARTGEAFQAAVSIHGLYDRPNAIDRPVKPAILLLHGWADPLAPPDSVLSLATELTVNCEDWQMLAFGNADTHSPALPQTIELQVFCLTNVPLGGHGWRSRSFLKIF